MCVGAGGGGAPLVDQGPGPAHAVGRRAAGQDRAVGKLADDPQRARSLLEQPSLAHVATLLPDGAPHGVPVWVGLEDGRAAFLTGPRSRKAGNLARDPRVCLSMTAPDTPAVMAQVRGRVAELVDGERSWAIIDRLSLKYLGGAYPLREDRVVFLVDLEHARGQAFT